MASLGLTWTHFVQPAALSATRLSDDTNCQLKVNRSDATIPIDNWQSSITNDLTPIGHWQSSSTNDITPIGNWQSSIINGYGPSSVVPEQASSAIQIQSMRLLLRRMQSQPWRYPWRER